jgi:hypothetical protein
MRAEVLSSPSPTANLVGWFGFVDRGKCEGVSDNPARKTGRKCGIGSLIRTAKIGQ